MEKRIDNFAHRAGPLLRIIVERLKRLNDSFYFAKIVQLKLFLLNISDWVSGVLANWPEQ